MTTLLALLFGPTPCTSCRASTRTAIWRDPLGRCMPCLLESVTITGSGS